MIPSICDRSVNLVSSLFEDFNELDDRTKRISIIALSYFGTMLVVGFLLKRYFDTSRYDPIITSSEYIKRLENINNVFLQAGPRIQSITLDDLKLRQMPENITTAINLVTLSLSKNNISSVPDQLTNLKHLRILNLSSNRFSRFPNQIFGMTQLNWLNMDDNGLREIDSEIIPENSLTELSLKHNLLSYLPDSFSALASLKRLFVNANLLTQYPVSIGRLTSLVSLNLESNAISTISEYAISPYLHNLSLSSNYIKNMDTGFENCSQLNYLNLSCNHLERILDNLDRLSSLTYLDLHRNNFTSIPVSIYSLQALYFLDISFNERLCSLPLSMGALTNLSELGFDNTSVPLSQFMAIFESIVRNRYDRHECFETKIRLWSQFCSNAQPFNFHNLSDFDRRCIYEWLRRLESTRDFSANQCELSLLVVEMMKQLQHNSFKEQFINQLSTNLSNCEDRSLMNLILLNLLFRIYNLEGTFQEDLDLLCQAAKSLYLPTVVSEILLEGRSTDENTEVFLFVFITLSSKLNLLLPYRNMRMHYKEFAIKYIGRGENPDLSFIEEKILQKPIGDLIVDLLPEAAEKFLSKHFSESFIEIQRKRIELYEMLEEKKESMTSLEYKQEVEGVNMSYYHSIKQIIDMALVKCI